MRIQHNIPALNAHRNLTNNNSSVSKNLEKLSSGYRINRAGDDAAGLAISEKMRAQITGLQTAQKNAEDGVSLVQTAEGALTEVHSMLNRMVELATQSANGTYSDANRDEMQKEIDALEAEIDRISKTSNFNGTYLFSDGDAVAAADPEITGKVNGADLTATDAPATATKFDSGTITFGNAGSTTDKVEIELNDGTKVELTVDLSTAASASDIADKIVAAANAHADLKDIVTATKNGTDKVTFTSKENGPDAPAVKAMKGDGLTGGSAIATGSVTAGKNASKTYDLSTVKDGDSITIGKETYTFKAGADGKDGKTFKDFASLQEAVKTNGTYKLDGTATAATVSELPKTSAAQKEIVLHVGESSSQSNQIAVKIDAMSANSLKVDTVDITTAAGARTAIDTINTAIDSISSIRSSLGAMQNRLEHTINNLGVQTENITAAESRIRDVDMAKEMMAYTKNNILVQASQAMLAQANQVPQGVLQLLQ